MRKTQTLQKPFDLSRRLVSERSLDARSKHEANSNNRQLIIKFQNECREWNLDKVMVQR